jgi:hypothetical protein
MRTDRLLQRLLVVACVWATTSGGFADWIADFEADAVYDSNLSNSDRSVDRVDDFSIGGSAHVGRFVHLARDLRLSGTLDFGAERFFEVDDFSHVSAGATLALRYRFGLGADAPFLRVEGHSAWTDFNDSVQDGLRSNVSVTLGKRLFARLDLQAGYGFDDSAARADLYDQQGHTGFLRAAFDLTETTQLVADFSLRRGDVVAYAQPPRPDLVGLAEHLVEVDTFGSAYTAYRFEATTHRAGFAIRQALTRQLGVTIGYAWQRTTRSDVEYTSHTLHGGVQFSF